MYLGALDLRNDDKREGSVSYWAMTKAGIGLVYARRNQIGARNALDRDVRARKEKAQNRAARNSFQIKELLLQ